jgi:hypothetical protein
MHNEITDDTGKVISLAEVSDYNIIYVGGLSPNLTYGKSYSTLKLNNSMYLINTFILSMIVVIWLVRERVITFHRDY